MPDNQQEQNLRNEILSRAEERHEEQAHEREQELDAQAQNEQEVDMEDDRRSVASDHSSMGEGRESNASERSQSQMSDQERWMEGLRAYQQYQAAQAQDRKQYDKAKREVDKKEKEREAKAKKREEKRRRRNQQYDARIEKGGPGAIWAALKKFFMTVVVDNVTDLARGIKDLAVLGAGAAKDAITNRIRERSEQAERQKQPDNQLAEQAQMLSFMERNGYLRQPSAQAENQQARQREPRAMQGPQPQAMPRALEQTPDFSVQRDAIGKNLNGLDNMCKSAALITGEQPSRRDLSMAFACMNDPAVSGMSAEQSFRESEKLMKFLSGEQLGPQDGPVNQELLKKGLDAARQPGAVEREGFLGAMHNMSRVISRAPSLDAPHRMAAGEALGEIAKECANAKNIVRAVSLKDAKIEANINANKTVRQIAEIRGAMTVSNLYRQGKQAQYDELDRVSQMQERGINPDAHRMSPDNVQAITIAESINQSLARRMTQERIRLNKQQDVSRRVEDIAKMPMPDPMKMKASNIITDFGKDPHMLDNVWQDSIGKLPSVQEMQNGPAVRVLDDMEKNRGAIAERMSSDIREIRENEKRQHEEEKHREREQERQNVNQNGRGMSA